MQARSSIGRAADSKSAGWGFESSRACQGRLFRPKAWRARAGKLEA